MVKDKRCPAAKTDVVIIGAGMAGLAAAVFAANRNIAAVITGKRSSMNFATGLMDVMGVYPEGKEQDNPWEAIELVRNKFPKHPYSHLTDEDIKESLSEISEFLKEQGLFYRACPARNVDIITSLGTLKKSYLVPESMWKGIEAFEKRAPSLFIDFTGMKIYSAKQIVSTLSCTWPGLESEKISFPGMEKLEEVYPEQIARSLDIGNNRTRLAETLRPLIDMKKNKPEYVGFPAVLGMYKSEETSRHIEQLLGIPVFEIPTPPVSVPGIRLHEALTSGLGQRSNLLYEPEMVESVENLHNGDFRIRISGSIAEDETAYADNNKEDIDHCNSTGKIIEARAVILATGRFMGKGLQAGRTGIRETLFDLPVIQPAGRQMWHHNDLFNPHGHPVNSAGIETDKMMRPLSRSKKPFAENMFAAGSILAHSDWTRMKCGSGVAIATAFASVKSLQSSLSL